MVRDFRLTDSLRHDWRDEVVYFPVDFQPGECDGTHYQLTRKDDRQPVPAQLIDVTRYPDGSVRQGRLVFCCDLPAGQTRAWRLGTSTAPPAPRSALTTTRDGARLVLSSGKISLLVPAGEQRFQPPVSVADVPAPLLGIKGPDGVWRGKGSLESPEKLTGWKAEITQPGPVLTEYRIEYRFAEDHFYRVTVQLYDGQNYAHVTEEANVGKTSRFVFSAYAGFAPSYYVLPDRDAQPLTYSMDRRLNRFFFNTYFHQVWDFKDWIAFFRDDPAASDYLAFVKVHGGGWTSPLHNAIYFEEKAAPDLRMSGTLRPCRREWLVAMFDRTQLAGLGKTKPKTDVLKQLCAKVGFAPLDMVKDMKLDWPLKPNPRPITAEERGKAEQLLRELRGLVDSSLTDGPYGQNHALGYGQRVDWWRQYPPLANSGAFSLEDERYVRAAMAYVAYTGMERDFFAWYLPLLPRENTADAEEPLQNWHYDFYMMNTNFDAARFCGIAEIAMSLSDHPDFDRFMAHYTQCLKLHLDNTFSPDGFYHESISYMWWDMFLLTRAATRVKQQTGVDHFADPALHKGFWCLVNLVTPNDPRYVDKPPRAMPHFGDHDMMSAIHRSPEWGSLITLGAEAYAKSDPQLAGALAWLWQQLGCRATPPNVAPRQPALRSAPIRGLGAVLRNNFGSRRESYVLYRCDPFVGRYQNEENSFYLFARGCPLILTPCDGFVDPPNLGKLTRNKVSFNEMGNYEQFWGQLGTLERYASLGGYDYLRGVVQGDRYQHTRMDWMESFQDKPHTHRRHFLSVGGDYFVITDETKCDYPADYTLQVLADFAEQQGEVVHCTGRFDVDLDVHFLAPAKSTIEVTPTRMRSNAAMIQQPLPMLRLLAQAPPNQPFLTVLAPYIRQQEEPARVERLSNLLAAHVTQGGKEDYVFLSPVPVTWKSGGNAFQGARAILRVQPRLEMLLLDAGSITAGAVSLQSTAGALLISAQADGSWRGSSSGEAKTVTLGGIPVAAISCGGKPLKWKAMPTGVVFTILAGDHQLSIRR
jgi:hypothetical protein